jgi:hypothetical protein
VREVLHTKTLMDSCRFDCSLKVKIGLPNEVDGANRRDGLSQATLSVGGILDAPISVILLHLLMTKLLFALFA